MNGIHRQKEGEANVPEFFLPLGAAAATAAVSLEVSEDLRERERISATGTPAGSANLLVASATGEVAAEFAAAVTEAAGGGVGDAIGRD